MNAAIRAVVRSAVYNGVRIYGVNAGYQGLIDDRITEMGVYSVADIIQKGGTMLHTSRSKEMYTPEGVKKAAETLKRRDIEGLVVIGGDGSYKGAAALAREGVRVIALPGTIDNDVACTDYSIGFDTAVNTIIEAISKIRDTSLSHNRVNVVETMGRSCGNLALFSGLAGGAEGICVPEIPYDIAKICAKTVAGKDRGKLHSIIVFAEGAGDLDAFCAEFEKCTAISVRRTVLGYIQRGGSPSAFDRILACRMGAMAVSLLIGGKTNRAVCLRGDSYVDLDIEEALNVTRGFDHKAYEVAMQLSI
jgi:6-phosphofructokinase 1